MTSEDCADRIASLKRQLFFHQKWQGQVQTDPELTANERDRKLAYHIWVIDRLRARLIDLEGH